MKIRHLVALVLLGLMLVWMLIPREHTGLDDLYSPAERDTTIHAVAADSDASLEAGAFTVRVAQLEQESFTELVRVRGRTQASRHVEVRAEASGRVVATPVPRGARVSEGDVLCQIAVDNREADLQEAVSREEQARLEYEGELDLQSRGLQAQVMISQRKASLDAATAAVERARLALERTRIRAPFDGIVESREIEVGDYMDMGGQCATMLDDEPMLLVGTVPERNIGKLAPDAPVEARLTTGERVTGHVRYLSRAADPASRSYRIEVELEPQDRPIRQGISTEIMISAEQRPAHLIPASALTLDDEGTPGVKIVDAENRVHFRNIEIIGESTDIGQSGFWVTGLPATVNLITLGQEVVFPGQVVQTASSLNLR